jgi:CDP-diacylglycerol--glycerol-3-phosphate 3-phosphatidyltransferase
VAAAAVAKVPDPGRGRNGRRDAGATIPGTVAVRAVPASLAQLPNALTVGRLALIPLFVAMMLDADGAGSWTTAAVFALAGATDQIDGWLARRWHVESAFGKFADPLADRLMIDAAVILLWRDGRLPWPALAVILVRDGVLLLATPLAVRRGYEFEVNFLGKTATWILYASLVGVIASGEDTAWALVLFWAGVAVALAAAVQYVASAGRTMRGWKR